MRNTKDHWGEHENDGSNHALIGYANSLMVQESSYDRYVDQFLKSNPWVHIYNVLLCLHNIAIGTLAVKVLKTTQTNSIDTICLMCIHLCGYAW